jgi:hypothetical protein
LDDDTVLTFKDAEIINKEHRLTVISEGKDAGEFDKAGIKRWYFQD